MTRRTGRFSQLVDSRSGVNRDCFATISPSIADLYRRHVTGLTTSLPRPALPVYQRLHASARPVVANCSHRLRLAVVEPPTGDEVPDHARKRREMASGPPVSAD